MEVRASTVEDRPAIEEFLGAHGSVRVARRGELVDALDHPSYSAWEDGVLVGLATYVVGDGDCELLTLHATHRRGGVGSALVSSVAQAARAAGCVRFWVVTTNDNVDALRFYQRRGFRLSELRRGAVDECRRTLKPEIPTVGDHGIPLRDELELEMQLP